MNLLKYIVFTCSTLLVLFGCADDDQVTNPSNTPVEIENDDDQVTNSPNSNEENNDDITGGNDKKENIQNNTNTEQQDSIFHFASFDLDIDYGENKEFEIDYEDERDGIEAKIEDKINNERLSGDEAFNRLRPIFEKLSINKDTEKSEVISEVLSAFNLNDNYTKFELEVRLVDGTEKEYNDLK